MQISTRAIVCAVLGHGEHGAIARLLTPADGLQAGYVRGGKSRRMRPILLPGNLVAAELRSRSETQLAALTVELIRSHATLHAEPLHASAIDWVCALTAAALPEGHPYPRLFDALDGLLTAIGVAGRAKEWAGGLVVYERLLIAELGYGEPLPPPASSEWGDLLSALRDNGELLGHDLLPQRAARVMAARERLIDRVRRVAA